MASVPAAPALAMEAVALAMEVVAPALAPGAVAAMAPEAEAPQPVRARELEETVLPKGIP